MYTLWHKFDCGTKSSLIQRTCCMAGVSRCSPGWWEYQGCRRRYLKCRDVLGHPHLQMRNPGLDNGNCVITVP